VTPDEGRAQAVEDHHDLGDLVHEHDPGQVEHPGDRERWQHRDDEQRQRDVLVHDAHPAPGVTEGSRQQPQVLPGEGDVGRLDGDVRAAGPHGDADPGRRERRGVVDAVADHGGHAGARQRGHRGRLVLRAQLGAHVGHAGATGHRGRGARVVAGEHRRADAAGGQRPDHLGSLRPQLVTDPDDAGHLLAPAHDDDGHAVLLQRGDVGGERAGGGPPRAADRDDLSPDGPPDAVPGLLDDTGRRGDPRRGPLHRRGQRVCAVPLDR